MSELTVTNHGILPREMPTPSRSEFLGMVMALPELSDGLSIPPKVREEASALLVVMEQFAAPATDEHLLAWLDPISTAVNHDMSPEKVVGRIKAIKLTLADCPRGALTLLTQRTLLKGLKFWPTTGEVYECVSYFAQAIKEEVRILRIISRDPNSR